MDPRPSPATTTLLLRVDRSAFFSFSSGFTTWFSGVGAGSTLPTVRLLRRGARVVASAPSVPRSDKEAIVKLDRG